MSKSIGWAKPSVPTAAFMVGTAADARSQKTETGSQKPEVTVAALCDHLAPSGF
jgi:hypothetical protein